MSPRMLSIRNIWIAFALLLPWTAQAVTITPEQAGVANFGQVSETYFRGAQPDQGALQRLHDLGIRTIVDLQEDPILDEVGWAKAAGLRYYNIPLSGSRPATDAQTAQFLSIVNDSLNGPVYVHCKVGRHRTGEMTGIYRIAHDSWSADQAYAEMVQYGYYAFPNHGSLRTYVYDYAANHKPTQVASESAP